MSRTYILALLALLALSANAADTWSTYSHPDPEFSVDYPSTWTATLADKVPDENWGDLGLKGKAKVTFRVTLDLDVLQIAVTVLGLEKGLRDAVASRNTPSPARPA